MRFLTGVASGFLGAANKEMEANRKERDEWRKLLFRHYTENTIPTYQKMKLTAMERANKAQQYGMIFQNKDLGNLAANTGDASTIMKLYQLTGGPSGGATVGLGGVPDSVKGLMGDDDLEGGPTPLKNIVDSVDQNYFLSQVGTPKSTTSDTGLMAQAPASAPREQNFWNRMLGTPDRGSIARDVAKDVGSMYGVSPEEILSLGRSTLNPSIPQLPVNPANLPKMKVPGVDRKYQKLMTYAGKARDPGKFNELVEKFYTTGDDKYATEAMSLVLSPEELLQLKGKHTKSGSSSNANYYRALLLEPVFRAAKFEAEKKRQQALASGKSQAEAQKAYDDAYNNYTNKLNVPRQFQNNVFSGFGEGTPDTSGVRDD